MATPSAILSVLVNADTAAATANLTKYDRQLQAVNDTARKGIETRLGATVDQAGFKAYEARLAKTAQIAKDRAAFKAELGANFNNAGFLAYERAIDKAKREAAAGVAVQVKIADAVKRLNDLQVRMGRIPDKIDTKVEVDTGVATAKLDLLQRKIRDVERDIAGGGGGRGGFLASLFGGGGGQAGGISGLLPGGGTAPIPGQLLAGLAPFAAGGIGSATAVAGSAGAAALGAGALGTGALGVGAAGLGPILALSGGMKDAIKLATQLQAAQAKLGGAQKLFGDKSKQAAAAQLAVNKIMAAADPAVLKFAQSWGKFTEVLDKAEQSVLPAFSKALTPILDAVTTLLPTIVQMAKIDLGGIGKGLAPLLNLLKSPDVKDSLLTLSRTFAQLAVPLGQAATNLLEAFLHVAVAAAPFLLQIAKAFESWTLSFSQITTPSVQFTQIIDGLVSQLKSWWELAKSIGGLMVTIFSAGAGTGQTLVNLLTQVVTQFNTWLNTKSGQDAMKAFFHNSADLVVALFRAFGPLIGAVIKLVIDLMPAFTQALNAMRPALDLIAGLASKVADALAGNGGLARAVALAAIAFLPGGPLILGLIALGSLLRNMPAIFHALRNAWRAVWDAMKIAFNTSLSFILGGLSSLLGAIKFLVDTANIKLPGIGHLFGNLGTSTSKHLGDAQAAIDNYRRTLTNAANRAKTDLGNIGTNTETMRDRVNAAVTKMTQSVQTGIVTADSALGREMKKLGVTVQQVLTGASSHPLQPKPAFYSGGMVTQPGYFAGEEAPMHPEVILATNPAYRSRNLGLWAQAGSMLGVPGFAQGGIAGNIGAMIAEANRVDAQHFPYLWGGGHGSFSGPFDCSGAVSDILHAGGVLNAPRVSGDFMNYGLPGPGPVTIYANPSHVYMSLAGKYFGTSGSNPGGGAGWFAGAPRPGFAVRHVGGSVDSIKTPEWTGPGGLLGKIGKKQVSLATKAANQTLSSALASSFGGSFGGGQHSENLANQALGKQMMLAAGFGLDQWPSLQALWTKESGWDATARNPQSGAAGIPQDITGNLHNGARGQIAWGLNYIRGRYGNPDGAWAHERAFNWYRKGGIHGKVRGFAKGGIFGRIPRFKSGGTFSSSVPKLVGDGARTSGLPSAGSVLGLPGLPSVGAPTVPSSIQGTITGNRNAIVGLEQSFGAIDQFYSLTGGSSFVDPNTGARNETAIKARLDQLAVLIAYRQKIFALWGFVVALTEKLIAANEERVRAFQAVLKSISTKGLKGKALTSAQKHIADAKTAITKYSTNAGTARTDLASAIGDRQSAWISLQSLLGEKLAVAGTVAQASSAIDTTSGALADSGVGSVLDNAPVTDTATIALLQQLLQQANQRTAVSEAQFNVLKTLPFGGSFATGGIVPGPVGAPSMIVAHGGEAVGMAPQVNINIAPGAEEFFRQFIQVEIAQAGRGSSRTASRRLPGSTGR